MSGSGYARAAKHAALGQTLELAATLRSLGAPVSEIADTLRAHHVSGLVRYALGKAPAPRDVAPALLAALDSVRPMHTATADELRSGFDEVRRRLEREGVPVLLLKGQHLSERLYRVPAWRPQFDIDASSGIATIGRPAATSSLAGSSAPPMTCIRSRSREEI